ncbi:MAG: T9SS type A sorting domain-containing protein [Dysgonamonadaceae bacterium]|jgi:hypothetical protein|nr:T9SS type A sorting domain-containing protein [Dysgonamonadaceae bacterium]
MKRANLRKLKAMLAIITVLFCVQTGASQEVIYDETGCVYTSYDGLVMCGYQGWFSCQGDPLNSGWFHYPRENKVQPGYINIDCWPDMSEYARKYIAPGFQYADGSQAYLFSSADSSTVDLHFKWMRDYGIDGVFVQRFVSQTVGGTGKTRVNTVLKHALQAARKYNRAIAVMYDGGIDNETQYNRITSDWNEIVEEFELFNPQKNPTFLRHKGKPVFALWGYGVNSRGYDPEWFDALCREIKGETAKKTSVMIGTPYYWREQGGDCVQDASYHPSLKKWVDIISPWAVGRYRSNNAISKVEDQVEGDLAWCAANSIDYVPVVFPGFSWHNMKQGDGNPYNDYPRESGNFLWKQVAAAKTKGADKLYIAMFDEMDEGTCIFKCETVDHTPLNGDGMFVGYENDLGSDYYLWLSGQATNWIHGQTGYSAAKPVRVMTNGVYLSASGNDANDGSTSELAVATLSRACALITEAGKAHNTIYVSGEVDGYSNPVANQNNSVYPFLGNNYTLVIQGIEGTNPKITGNTTARMFRLRADMALQLKDLTVSGEAEQVFEGNAPFLLMAGGSLEAENVVFENFSASQEGAVIQMNTISAANPLISLKNCIFRNNTSTGTNGNIIRLQQYGASAESTVSNAKIHVENCAFVNNATMYGVVFLRTANIAESYPEITFVNSTFAANSVSNGNGGTITGFSGNQTVNIINCTVKDNTGRGVTAVAALAMNIQNSVMEGNSPSDLMEANVPLVNISHSLIANENDANYTKPAGYTPSTILNDLDSTTYSFSPVEGSFALNYGNAQYLKDLGIYTDQLGKRRNFTNNFCTAGAVENPVQQACSDCEPKDYMHLIMYGQSLSTGHESHVTLSAENVPGNYMIGDQIWINYGNSDSQNLHPLQGTRAKGAPADIIECPLLGAANHIQLKGLHENIIATSAGTSGKPIEDLSKESQVSTLYNDYTTALNIANAVVKKTNSTITCPAIFWLQGEWNYQGYGNGLTAGSTPTADKDAYKALMITLKNNMQNDAKATYGQTEAPVFYTYQVGVQYSVGRELKIGMAQLEASNEADDIVCTGPVYPMTDVGGHLDANGYRWYGEMLGKVYYKTRVLGEDFKPLQPLSLARDKADAKKVIIKYLVPHLPLVLDEKTLAKVTDYGFEVYNNNVRQSISGVSASGDSVILTCTQNLTGKIEVTYAGTNAGYVNTANGNGRGHGNLRDSDPYPSFFTYQDLDKKDDSGNYIYLRHPNEASASLRPAFEPKDAAGNVIYNQPYPLYNFSVSFYYAIEAGEQQYTVPHLPISTGLSETKKDGSHISIVQSGKRISIHAPGQGNVRAEMLDISGRLCAHFSQQAGGGEWDVSTVPAGCYVVLVTTAANVKTQKIIIRY